MDRERIFKKLFEVIDERRQSGDAESSYVARLFAKGTIKINSKIMEEAGEVCEAAREEDKTHLVYEICDLLFHLFVLAGHKDVSLEEIESELARRFGISGIEEKQKRVRPDKYEH